MKFKKKIVFLLFAFGFVFAGCSLKNNSSNESFKNEDSSIKFEGTIDREDCFLNIYKNNAQPISHERFYEELEKRVENGVKNIPNLVENYDCVVYSESGSELYKPNKVELSDRYSLMTEGNHVVMQQNGMTIDWLYSVNDDWTYELNEETKCYLINVNGEEILVDVLKEKNEDMRINCLSVYYYDSNAIEYLREFLYFDYDTDDFTNYDRMEYKFVEKEIVESRKYIEIKNYYDVGDYTYDISYVRLDEVYVTCENGMSWSLELEYGEINDGYYQFYKAYLPEEYDMLSNENHTYQLELKFKNTSSEYNIDYIKIFNGYMEKIFTLDYDEVWVTHEPLNSLKNVVVAVKKKSIDSIFSMYGDKVYDHTIKNITSYIYENMSVNYYATDYLDNSFEYRFYVGERIRSDVFKEILMLIHMPLNSYVSNVLIDEMEVPFTIVEEDYENILLFDVTSLKEIDIENIEIKFEEYNTILRYGDLAKVNEFEISWTDELGEYHAINSLPNDELKINENCNDVKIAIKQYYDQDGKYLTIYSVKNNNDLPLLQERYEDDYYYCEFDLSCLKEDCINRFALNFISSSYYAVYVSGDEDKYEVFQLNYGEYSKPKVFNGITWIQGEVAIKIEENDNMKASIAVSPDYKPYVNKDGYYIFYDSYNGGTIVFNINISVISYNKVNVNALCKYTLLDENSNVISNDTLVRQNSNIKLSLDKELGYKYVVKANDNIVEEENGYYIIKVVDDINIEIEKYRYHDIEMDVFKNFYYELYANDEDITQSKQIKAGDTLKIYVEKQENYFPYVIWENVTYYSDDGYFYIKTPDDTSKLYITINFYTIQYVNVIGVDKGMYQIFEDNVDVTEKGYIKFLSNLTLKLNDLEKGSYVVECNGQKIQGENNIYKIQTTYSQIDIYVSISSISQLTAIEFKMLFDKNQQHRLADDVVYTKVDYSSYIEMSGMTMLTDSKENCEIVMITETTYMCSEVNMIVVSSFDEFDVSSGQYKYKFYVDEETGVLSYEVVNPSVSNYPVLYILDEYNYIVEMVVTIDNAIGYYYFTNYQ